MYAILPRNADPNIEVNNMTRRGKILSGKKQVRVLIAHGEMVKSIKSKSHVVSVGKSRQQNASAIARQAASIARYRVSPAAAIRH
jgi:hypothetical protein